MQTIKTNTGSLGENNYEKYLITQHATELSKLLYEWEIPAKQTKVIMALHKKLVTKDNIGKLYTHPIQIFLDKLLDEDLTHLYLYSSSRNTELIKAQYIEDNQSAFLEFKEDYFNQGTEQELKTDFYLIKRGYKALTIKQK